MSSLWLSIKVVLWAMCLVVPLGGWLGYRLARGRGFWRNILDGLISIPLVMPPSVVGYLLLRVFSRKGTLGGLLERWMGIHVVFSTLAVVIAVIVVTLPLMTKGAETAFLRVDHELEDVARVHGLSRWQTVRFVSLPLALPGLAVAIVLTALRGLGEFGATLLFAGYVPGVTNTVPIEMYIALQEGNETKALNLALCLCGISIASALGVAWWSRKNT